MSDVRISVGAVHDRRMTDVCMSDMASSMRRANATIAAQSLQSQRAITSGVSKGAKERVRAESEAEREIRAIMRRQESEQRRSSERITRDRLRDIARGEREQIASAKRSTRESMRERERFAARTSHRATRFLFPRPEGALGMARRVGTDLLRGLGVDTSVSGGVGRAVSLEKQAQTLANNAYQPGMAGAAGRRVSSKTLTDEARGHAERYGTEGGAETIIGGQTKFNKLTGDLQMARDLTGDMVKLSAATGANFEDTMGAAAVLSRKLGDIPDKQKKIYELMRGFAWQGKLGAVEISDLASTMPRLLSGVTRFAGDTGTNIAKMGALAQLARGGPAGTAREAATGVARMTDLFVTPARIKAMKKLGMKQSDIFDKNGMLNDPFEIIKRALTVTGGDPLKMKGMFSSIMGSKPVERLSDLYRQGGRGAGGMAAVNGELNTLMSGSGVGMSEAVVAAMAEKQAETMANKAAKFQEKLDRITESLAENLLPALEKLAPVALSAAEGMSKAIVWISNNLGSAITLAIVGSIARAGLESAFRTAVDRSFGVGAKPGSFTGRNPGFGGVIGSIGMGAAIGIPLATGIYAGGVERFNEKNAQLSGMMKELSTASGPELKEKLLQAREMARGERGSTWGRMARNFGIGNKAELLGLESTIASKEAEYQQDPTGAKAKALGGAQRQQTASDIGAGVATALQGKVLSVEARVTNFPPTPGDNGPNGASVDPGGRQAPVGQR